MKINVYICDKCNKPCLKAETLCKLPLGRPFDVWACTGVHVHWCEDCRPYAARSSYAVTY